jgi:pyruvate dehydrogenase E1 component
LAPALPLDVLKDLERKVLWLATQTIHHANHERHHERRRPQGRRPPGFVRLAGDDHDGALFRRAAARGPGGRQAHASPVFHAIQYLLGNQDVEQLKRFRAFGGAQSYPSRTKDADDVDFSTGSVGLGRRHDVVREPGAGLHPLKALGHAMAHGPHGGAGRRCRTRRGQHLRGLLEGFKHGLRNTWWIIDYNRQSLDAVLTHLMTPKLESLFDNMGWTVVTVKYGRKLEALRSRAGRRAHPADGSTSATTRCIRRSPSKAGRMAPRARARPEGRARGARAHRLSGATTILPP